MPHKPISEWETWVRASARDFLRFKWNSLTSDRRSVILAIVEIILAVCIAAAIAIYLDPEWNVVPFPWNVATFAVLVGVALLIHRRTRPYRVARRLKKKWEKKVSQ
jgi:hypothetical protein